MLLLDNWTPNAPFVCSAYGNFHLGSFNRTFQVVEPSAQVEDEFFCSRRKDSKSRVVANGNWQDESNGKRENFREDVALLSLLKDCAKRKDLVEGSKLHAEILTASLLGKDTFIATSLIDMYVKCGAIEKAEEVFNNNELRDVVMWNALIAGYVQHGNTGKALNCFEQMQDERLSPNATTYTCILKACGSIRAADKGKDLHVAIVKLGWLEKDVKLGNALVDLYAKCSMLGKAQEVFDELPIRDIVSWNTLIGEYAQERQGDEALKLFERMHDEGFSPDAITFIHVLKACSTIGATKKGREIHSELVRQGFMDNDIKLGTALVDMYAKCGALSKAQEVFDELPVRNAISWNALISGYAQHGHNDKALKYFVQMKNDSLIPDVVTYTSILKSCGSKGDVKQGAKMYAEIVKQGFLEKDAMLGTALVDMYSKCGALAKADRIFSQLQYRDAIAWSALIAGYAQHGYSIEALHCFEKMHDDGIYPDAIIFTLILKACSNLGAVEKGREIHAAVARWGFLKKYFTVGNALIDMYAKCGALCSAQEVFSELPILDLVSWNALIAGFAQHGYVNKAVYCSFCLQGVGLLADDVTFIILLNAYAHSGLVDEGQLCFSMMWMVYGIIPTMEQQSCMVDLYSRAGQLNKAMEMIEKFSPCDHHLLWFNLLSACQKWGYVNIARFAFDHVVGPHLKLAAACICMSNIYASAGMRREMETIEAMGVKHEALEGVQACFKEQAVWV